MNKGIRVRRRGGYSQPRRSPATKALGVLRFGRFGRWAGPRGGFSVLVCVALMIGVWIVFGQTVRHEFVNFDDDNYVYANPIIMKGLSFGGIAWAFTHFHAD